MKPIHIAVAGHVDHGKSTLIASLLVGLGKVPQEKINLLRSHSESRGRSFEPAYLLDAFKDEQNLGITIEGARLRLETNDRVFRIFDCPGHLEFLKNMLTGASQADSAILVVDAAEGIRENTKRHATLLSFLGIRQVIVAVNKLDLCTHQEERFQEICRELASLPQISQLTLTFIPVIARDGINVVTKTLSWWHGPSLLEAMTDLSHGDDREHPFRFQVQDVYLKKTKEGYDRIFAGLCQSGRIRAGDELLFLPSQIRTRVQKIESFPSGAQSKDLEIRAGQSGAFQIADRRHILRGEIAVLANDHSEANDRTLAIGQTWRARLVWLGHSPLNLNQEYIFKLGTLRVRAKIRQIEQKVETIDSSEANGVTQSVANLVKNELAEILIETETPIAVDLSGPSSFLSRFVLVHQWEICGAGFVSNAESFHRTESYVSSLRITDRELRNRHQARLILMNRSWSEENQKLIADLEKRLFDLGMQVAVLGSGGEKSGHDGESGDASQAAFLIEKGFVVLYYYPELSVQEIESLGRRIGRERIVAISLDANLDPRASDWIRREPSSEV